MPAGGDQRPRLRRRMMSPLPKENDHPIPACTAWEIRLPWLVRRVKTTNRNASMANNLNASVSKQRVAGCGQEAP